MSFAVLLCVGAGAAAGLLYADVKSVVFPICRRKIYIYICIYTIYIKRSLEI